MGFWQQKRSQRALSDIKIIILTTFDDDEFIYSALKYGASGYLLKGASTEELYEAIKVVYQGGAMINPNIASKVFQIFSQMAKTNFSIAVDEDNVKDLSTTEWRIIQEVGYGESNKEIAAKLFLSEGTVRNYLSTILAKLNLRDRTQLAIWSVQTGVTRRDFFLKEIRNEIEAKVSFLGNWTPFCALYKCGFLLVETATDRAPYRRLCRF